MVTNPESHPVTNPDFMFMPTPETLVQLRSQIDCLDAQLVELLNQRALFASEIGRLKAAQERDFHVPSREREVHERVATLNKGPLPTEALRGIFREIMSACLALESPVKVAFLGPLATFTHMAAMQQFGMSAQLVPQKSIPSVFEEVEKGRALYGVVPVENSTEGMVSHTLDMFVESDLKITAEVLLEVSHDLLSRTGRIEDVRKVYSHPQALAQCRHWLEENLPNVPLVDVASTALAAQIVSEDLNAAAIAGCSAAEHYGLKVVRSRIEDQINNFTRFIVVARKMAEPSGNDKTSILFSVRDEPGILYRMLEPFARRGVNLSKIESRPVKTKAWEYIFFLDMAGHVADQAVQDAIDELRQFCQFLKILGSFPKAR
jgi:chorismate mutase/prephenate dehydratase